MELMDLVNPIYHALDLASARRTELSHMLSLLTLLPLRQMLGVGAGRGIQVQPVGCIR